VSLEDEIVQGVFGRSALRLGGLAERAGKPLPGWLGALLLGFAQRSAEREHGRTRRQLLRIDDHLSDLLAFTGRPE
jgi:preprotein translocase subunit SecA